VKFINFSKKIFLFAWNYRHSYQLVLLSLTLLGLLIRLWVAWKTNQSLPDTSARLLGDEQHYDGLARSVLVGSFFQWPGRTPVYSLFLAGCYLIFGSSYNNVLYVQAFLGASVIPLTFLLARYVTAVRSSLAAAAIVMLHPSLIFQVKRLLSENLYTPLLLLSLLSLLWALNRPLISRFSLGGVLIAITNLCRPTAALFPFLVPLLMPRSWTWKRKIQLSLAYLGAVVVVTAPWVYHNYQTYHAFLPYSVSLTALWQGSPEFYHLAETRDTPWINFWDYVQPARSGYDIFSIEGDRYFNARAIASIQAEPAIYAWYSLQKLAFFWIGNTMVDWPHGKIFNLNAMRPYYSSSMILITFVVRLLPFLGLAGLIILRKRLRDFLPLLVVCGYFMMIHAITYAEIRYSEPLYPILATIIATASGEMQRRYESKIKYSETEGLLVTDTISNQKNIRVAFFLL
jgi:4-amino-4-deoxy-L-arabinose transferase-like glycosyltransferase